MNRANRFLDNTSANITFVNLFHSFSPLVVFVFFLLERQDLIKCYEIATHVLVYFELFENSIIWIQQTTFLTPIATFLMTFGFLLMYVCVCVCVRVYETFIF